MNKRLVEIQKAKGYKLETIGELVSRKVCKMVKGKTAPRYISVTQSVPTIKVRNVANEGIIWQTDHVLRMFFNANPEALENEGYSDNFSRCWHNRACCNYE